MKKVFATLTVLAMLAFGSNVAFAQEEAAPAQEAAVETVDEAVAPAAEVSEEVAPAEERIIYLSLSKTNTKVLLAKVEKALNEGGIEAALDVCRNTRGPVASIFYQGLSRYNEGVDVVEKTVASYGGVQLGLLEKNLSWISLFISIAPSLGFLGTIIGMIAAFDKIQQVGDISATVVAGGIKVALLTTLLGLIIAIVLQLFYNYILSLIEGLVNEMEDSSISLLDLVVEFDKKQAK